MKYTSLLFAFLFLNVGAGLAASAPDEPNQPPFAPTHEAEELSKPKPVGAERVGGAPTVFTARLHIDGNLVGHVRLARNRVKPTPLLARVSFWSEGVIVDAARTGESGHFQLTGLKPGQYQAVIMSQFVGARIQVNVLPYEETAKPDELLLDLTLGSAADGANVVTGEDVAAIPLEGTCPHCGKPIAECECQPAPAAGCCCCKKDHKWLLGLAGLAGLAGPGNGEPVVTPFKPDPH